MCLQFKLLQTVEGVYLSIFLTREVPKKQTDVGEATKSVDSWSEDASLLLLLLLLNAPHRNSAARKKRWAADLHTADLAHWPTNVWVESASYGHILPVHPHSLVFLLQHSFKPQLTHEHGGTSHKHLYDWYSLNSIFFLTNEYVLWHKHVPCHTIFALTIFLENLI